MSAPVALVLGLGVNLTEVVRALWMAGIRAHLVTPAGDPARSSRRADAVVTWEWSDPRWLAHEPELVERLVAHARTLPDRPALLVTCDEALLFASRHRDALGQACELTLAPPEVVEVTADKVAFAELAGRLGLPVPATAVVEPRAGPLPPEVAALDGPLVVKPHRRTRRWHDHGIEAKALEVDGGADLAEVWPVLVDIGEPLLVQQRIPGSEARVESYHVYVDRHGCTAAELTGRKIRTFPIHCGHTTALEITHAPDVLAFGRDVVAALGLTGMAKLDCKRDDEGALHLLEVNARSHLWAHPSAVAGVNLPALACAEAAGHRPTAVGPARPGVRWVHPRDVQAARAERMGTASWVRFALSCDARGFWRWDDPMPLVAALRRGAGDHDRPGAATGPSPGPRTRSHR